MPLEQRVIEPILVSQGTLPLDSQVNLAISIPNELECVTNGTLANIIRQLSSLSHYAEDLFGGILHEATLLIARATTLQGRIDRLAVKVTQLDYSVEEVSLHDIHLKKPFKSCLNFDQQVVARKTMPESINDRYKLCDKPPPLDVLNPYRDDGKDGLKFYTDPNYFFDLWKQQMLKETEKVDRVERKKGAHRGLGSKGPGSGDKKVKKPRQPANTRDRYREAVAPQEFLDPREKASHYIDANGTYMNSYNNNNMKRPDSLDLSYMVDNMHLGNHNQQGMQANPPAYHDNGPHGHYQMLPNQMSPSHNNMPNHQQRAGTAHTPPPPYQLTPQDTVPHNQQTGQMQLGTPTRRAGSVPSSRPSQPPPAPPSNPPSSSSSSGGTPTVGTPSRSRGQSLTRDSLPPPPPPPPLPQDAMVAVNGIAGGGDVLVVDTDLPLPPPVHQNLSPTHKNNNYIPGNKTAHYHSAAPPAPPPPPPFPGSGATNISDTKMDRIIENRNNFASSLAQQIQNKHTQLHPPKLSTMNKILPNHVQGNDDARSDLLAAIREGIKLRRVQDSKQKEVEKTTPLHDVASILARRVAMELSDSDSGGGGGSDGSDSDAWDSEC